MLRKPLVRIAILVSVAVAVIYFLSLPPSSPCKYDRKLVVNYLMQIDIHGTQKENIKNTLDKISKQCIYDEFKELSQDEFEILVLTATEYYENYYKTYIDYEKTQKDKEAVTDTIQNETLSIEEYIDSYIEGYKIQRKQKMEEWQKAIEKKDTLHINNIKENKDTIDNNNIKYKNSTIGKSDTIDKKGIELKKGIKDKN